MTISAFTVCDAFFSSSSDDDWMDDWMLFSSSSSSFSSDDDEWSSDESDDENEKKLHFSDDDEENEKLQRAKQKIVPQNEPNITPPKGPQPKKTPKCAICLDEIEKPTATKCGHVYCDQCIRECIRAQKTKSRCPQCRKKVGLSGLTKLILDD